MELSLPGNALEHVSDTFGRQSSQQLAPCDHRTLLLVGRVAHQPGAAREVVLVDQGKVARLPLVFLFVAVRHDRLRVELPLSLGLAGRERVCAELTRRAWLAADSALRTHARFTAERPRGMVETVDPFGSIDVGASPLASICCQAAAPSTRDCASAVPVIGSTSQRQCGW